jgi:hypothetical protein
MLVVDGEGGLQVVVDVAQKLWYKLRWCGSFYTNLKTVMMKSTGHAAVLPLLKDVEKWSGNWRWA